MSDLTPPTVLPECIGDDVDANGESLSYQVELISLLQSVDNIDNHSNILNELTENHDDSSKSLPNPICVEFVTNDSEFGNGDVVESSNPDAKPRRLRKPWLGAKQKKANASLPSSKVGEVQTIVTPPTQVNRHRRSLLKPRHPKPAEMAFALQVADQLLHDKNNGNMSCNICAHSSPLHELLDDFLVHGAEENPAYLKRVFGAPSKRQPSLSPQTNKDQESLQTLPSPSKRSPHSIRPHSDTLRQSLLRYVSPVAMKSCRNNNHSASAISPQAIQREGRSSTDSSATTTEHLSVMVVERPNTSDVGSSSQPGVPMPSLSSIQQRVSSFRACADQEMVEKMKLGILFQSNESRPYNVKSDGASASTDEIKRLYKTGQLVAGEEWSDESSKNSDLECDNNDYNTIHIEQDVAEDSNTLVMNTLEPSQTERLNAHLLQHAMSVESEWLMAAKQRAAVESDYDSLDSEQENIVDDDLDSMNASIDIDNHR